MLTTLAATERIKLSGNVTIEVRDAKTDALARLDILNETYHNVTAATLLTGINKGGFNE